MKKINWSTTLFILTYHAVLIVGLPLFFIYGSFNWPIMIVTLALWLVTGFSVTAGYHRLYSHQTYKAHWLIESLLLFFGSMSVQGSVYSWAYDHRLHHAHADTDKDPYTVKDGILHAHLLWMFTRLPKIDGRIVRDLERKRLVMHQHRYYLLWMLASNLIPVLLMGWITGAYLTSFLFVWVLRMFLCHHCTWFINSLAHYWGARTFSKEQSAVDNFFLSIMTFGEGYHNYHHTFARDYRNGVRWYHYDPTKWIIWTLSKVGLVTSLIRIPDHRIREKMVIEQRADLLDRIRTSLDDSQEAVSQAACNLSDELMQLFQRLKDPTLRDRAISERLVLERQLKRTHKSWVSLVKRFDRLQLS